MKIIIIIIIIIIINIVDPTRQAQVLLYNGNNISIQPNDIINCVGVVVVPCGCSIWYGMVG